MGGLLKSNNKKHKVKRGGRKHKKKTESLIIFSSNAQGLKSKIQSLKSELKSSNAGVFTIQESHFRKKGKLKLDNFEFLKLSETKKVAGQL